MKKKLLITTGMFAIAVLCVLNNRQNKPDQAEAKEKRKVLVLYILEENWDTLEFGPRRHKGKPYIIRKKDFFKHHKEKDMKYVIERIKFSMSKGTISNMSKLAVFHEILYYGKTAELKESDTFNPGKFRCGYEYFVYSYENIPNIISLISDPDPHTWRDFKHIRLTDDINIVSNDEAGNLRVKYSDKSYHLKVWHQIILPTRNQNFSKEEVMNFDQKFKGKLKGTVQKTNSKLFKNILHFKTKARIINFGYVEI